METLIQEMERDSIETPLGQAALFKRCMGALKIRPAYAFLGADIISKRRWRRFEQGRVALPPRAWDKLADELEQAGGFDYLLYLVNRVRETGQWRGSD